MDPTPSVDPLEASYAPPIPDEWRHDIAAYREMIAAADLARYRQEQRAARAARAALVNPMAINPSLRSFMDLPKQASDIIEEKVQRLTAILDARNSLAST